MQLKKFGQVFTIFIILQYFQTKYNFHAVLYEHQLKKIRGIFKPEKMKIRPSEIKLLQQLSLKWETVGGPDRKGRCYNEMWKFKKLILDVLKIQIIPN